MQLLSIHFITLLHKLAAISIYIPDIPRIKKQCELTMIIIIYKSTLSIIKFSFYGITIK